MLVRFLCWELKNLHWSQLYCASPWMVSSCIFRFPFVVNGVWQMLHVHFIVTERYHFTETFSVNSRGVTSSRVCVELRCWEIRPAFIECVGGQVVKKKKMNLGGVIFFKVHRSWCLLISGIMKVFEWWKKFMFVVTDLTPMDYSYLVLPCLVLSCLYMYIYIYICMYIYKYIYIRPGVGV